MQGILRTWKPISNLTYYSLALADFPMNYQLVPPILSSYLYATTWPPWLWKDQICSPFQRFIDPDGLSAIHPNGRNNSLFGLVEKIHGTTAMWPLTVGVCNRVFQGLSCLLKVHLIVCPSLLTTGMNCKRILVPIASYCHVLFRLHLPQDLQWTIPR